MGDKIFEAARLNEQSPAPGFAAVNTHNPGKEHEPDHVPPQQVPDSEKHEDEKEKEK